MVTVLSFLLLNNVFAEDQYEVLSFEHPTNPTVCIMEPDYVIQDRFHKEILTLTARAVLVWQNEMTEYAGGNWYMPIEYYEYEKHFDKTPEDFPMCNIFLEFRQYNTGNPEVEGTANRYALGWTAFDFSKSWHKWAFVMVYLETSEKNTHLSFCIGCDDDTNIENKRKELSLNTVDRIIRHEFAHALGVGHYIEDTNKSNNIESMMYPSINPNIEYKELNYIPLADKEILSQIYGGDGFGGRDGVRWDVGMYDIVEGIIKTIKKGLD